MPGITDQVSPQTVWLNNQQLALMRSKHPSLLDQANGYGGQVFADGCKLSDLPGVLASAVIAACEAGYGPDDRRPV